MTDAQILERIRDVFQDLFEVPRSAVVADTSPQTLESWDSLQHLNVVLALEQTFSVEFTPEEIEQLVSVGAMVAALQKKLTPGVVGA